MDKRTGRDCKLIRRARQARQEQYHGHGGSRRGSSLAFPLLSGLYPPMPLRDLLALVYARVGFAGLSPVMPGTCGSLVATLLAPFIFMPLPFWGRVLALLFVFISGAAASGRAEILLGQSDPGQVVIDEVLGQWLVFLPFAALRPWEYLAGFLLFRVFDILKPWPVRSLEALGGGLGIMIDDAAAGLYALLCLALLRRFL